jgi:prophage regulatory protein
MPAEQPNNQPRFLKVREVCQRTSISRTSLYRMVEAKEFPHPAQISDHRIAFLESAVTAWIEQRAQASQPEADRPSRIEARRKRVRLEQRP